MAEEVKTEEKQEQTAPEESKPKRKKVTFTKNVKSGKLGRKAKGESAFVDAGLAAELIKSKVAE
ncbi:hypothetical protein [Sporolactobacillus terrae]|uniref:hypothetical protein n=1 Tax=Sporolactobacillus terrae TaxID=269673 RepID=UPI00048D1ECC|nr:hypothetical protein [Sporolactobacillus terrae]